MSWLSAIVAAVVGALKGWFGNKSEPTLSSVSEEKATAQNELAHQESANAATTKSATDRGRADLRVVQSIAPEGVDADANEKLAQQFPDQFRD